MRNKKIITMWILLFSFCIAAEAKAVITLGGQMTSILGSGQGGNTYGPAFGGFSEIGISGSMLACVLGVGISSGKNKAGNSSINATFYPMYLDGQVFFSPRSKIQPVFSLSLGAFFTKFPNLEGYVIDGFLALGGGVRTALSQSKNSYLRLIVKPIFLMSWSGDSNDTGLDQRMGIEVDMGLSFTF